ncbi:MarC family protein [Acetobacter peroxydans]|jgi:multiple antibiotic resistance protein|uniref:MarC family protein n=1 Tax=Acetobacter peroxydans TaxID=104098 RepID=UPI002351FDDB|nr:MarC family protein [Acetobacter peroxydans]MCH4142850.1 MarC family protein [Acetobacter peroxydans]MCI1395149.1 MarC family protein [Acetobacter peroxydans]MCI1410590.1 MarC family protein [Acetobacter peroxydans]MCI1439651.1 MarC family protein [Acetobacter peroxydans]MCI1565509.1 MarC family protein [Acetobacter peroxydans]
MSVSLGGFLSSVTVHTTTSAFLLAFPALFSIVNPFGAALIFAQATEGRSKTEIQALARLVSFYSFMLMIVSLWFGGAVLAFFGITVSALRVAGGLVVAVSAWELLQRPENTEARKERQALQDGRTVQAPNWSDSAFFPLAMPFTVGPGTIAVAIALGSSSPVEASPWAYGVGISLGAVGVVLLVWVAYSSAEKLVTMLGVTGTRIVSRLAALVLLCIGVQIMAAGVQGFAVDIWQHMTRVGPTARG